MNRKKRARQMLEANTLKAKDERIFDSPEPKSGIIPRYLMVKGRRIKLCVRCSHPIKDEIDFSSTEEREARHLAVSFPSNPYCDVCTSEMARRASDKYSYQHLKEQQNKAYNKMKEERDGKILWGKSSKLDTQNTKPEVQPAPYPYAYEVTNVHHSSDADYFFLTGNDHLFISKETGKQIQMESSSVDEVEKEDLPGIGDTKFSIEFNKDWMNYEDVKRELYKQFHADEPFDEVK